MSSQALKSYLNWTIVNELKSLSAGGENLFETLISNFLGKAPLAFQNLKKAHAEKNATAVIVYTHRLNGFSANLGADTLASLCTELERKGKQCIAPETNELLKRLEMAFQQVLSEVEALKKSPSKSLGTSLEE